ncbi:MAG TPA: peroxidase-related enzyme [Longimicrobiaceae bacterium]|jgi:uncharacterized peroxidase-related enzyme|nr:peroxidase-related enzyme [Longimicrobiaceae bacterium]
MAHIPVPEGQPGIRGLMSFRPETALPLNQLVEVLLQGPSALTKGERELIATYVSSLNRCKYCSSIHGAIAKAHLRDGDVVARVKADPETAPISAKLKALLRIAEKVQMGGRNVSDEDVAAARAEGASDVEIHDAVLIAAAFCMFNRYVDGLATWAPDDPELYDQMGAHRAETGYLTAGKPLAPK